MPADPMMGSMMNAAISSWFFSINRLVTSMLLKGTMMTCSTVSLGTPLESATAMGFSISPTLSISGSTLASKVSLLP